MRLLAGLLVIGALAVAGCGGSNETQPAVSAPQSGTLTVQIIGVGGPLGNKSTPMRGMVFVDGSQGKNWRARVTDARTGASFNLPLGTYLVAATARGATCDQEYVTVKSSDSTLTNTRTCSLK